MHENKKQKNRGKITKEYKRTRSELGLSLKHSYDFLLCFSCPHFISGNAKVLHWFIYRCRSLFTLKIIKAIQFDWCCCCLRLQPVFFYLYIRFFVAQTLCLVLRVRFVDLNVCLRWTWAVPFFCGKQPFSFELELVSPLHIYISGVSITFNCEC